MTMDDAPAVKPWGSEDKELLQKLINQGKVDITRTNDLAYIDRVKHKHFRTRETYNFRRNFRNYARSRELEDHLAGYRHGKVKYFFASFILLTLFLKTALRRCSKSQAAPPSHHLTRTTVTVLSVLAASDIVH